MTQNRDDIEIISHNPFGIAFTGKQKILLTKKKYSLFSRIQVCYLVPRKSNYFTTV
jgi:hypothetical protein